MTVAKTLEVFIVGVSALLLIITLAGNPSSATKNDVDFAAEVWKRDLEGSAKVSFSLLKRIQRIERKAKIHVPYSEKIIVGNEAM